MMLKRLVETELKIYNIMKTTYFPAIEKLITQSFNYHQLKFKCKSSIVRNLFISLNLLLIFFSGNVIFSACSGGKTQEKQTTQVVTTEKPTEQPHKLPEFNSEELEFLKAFNPLNLSVSTISKNSSEVYTSDNYRAFAFNEYTEGKIITYMYGGNSEENKQGRWFCEKVMQWDPSTQAWKDVFDSGMYFDSSLNKDIPLTGRTWYYTAQWVWDPLAKEWLKFDTNLLFQRS